MVIDLSSADFVIEINGTPVGSKQAATDAISRSDPERPIRLTVRKGLRAAPREVAVKPVLD